ncbi:MAG: type II secretion system F family protein [Actinomycetaceae bacterium]|nr:type II secretion system F family protein [Actinomycetaceae bacterium]
MAYLPGILMALGVVLITEAIRKRRALLEERVLAYLGGGGSSHRARGRLILSWMQPVWETFGSTTASVESRLEQIGTSTVERFRIEQMLAGVVGLGGSTLLVAIMNTVKPIVVYHWLLLALVGGCAGMLGWDQFLTYRARKITRRISRQVADTAELLALSVSAGESIPNALHRVQRVSGDELGSQLKTVLNLIEAGVPVSRALANLANQTHSPQLARLLDTLTSAIDRGTPLSQTLREQARDLRDEARRNLIESGGRKEIAMLFPVVFIILPITVVFALYPGLVALTL